MSWEEVPMGCEHNYKVTARVVWKPETFFQRLEASRRPGPPQGYRYVCTKCGASYVDHGQD